MRTWVRSLSSPPRRASRRPAVEALEDRCVPATGFSQVNLVSDQANTALLTDPKLVDAWGVALNPTGGNFWVADNRTNTATFYGGDVSGSPFVKAPLEVQIPFDAPSGAVFNGGTGFTLSEVSPAPAEFLVSEETAWAAAWNQGLSQPTQAQSPIDTSLSGPHVYEGIALAQNGSTNLLYLTNIHSKAIEVFGSNFQAATVTGTFTDPNLPAGFSPFNIANISGQLYVTYALQNSTQDGDEPGLGNGLVDVFNPDGTFVKRLVSNGTGSLLNSPWGLAVAPAGFGTFGGDLLVGNFGDGTIHAYNLSTGDFAGTLNDASGNPITIDGLWGLQFGNGVSAGDTNTLYFAAGPAGETHGLFGALHANGTNPLTGAATSVTGTAGSPLSGVLATFADTTPGLTAADFNVTITINGQNPTAGVVTANANGPGFFITGPNTNPPAGSDTVAIAIQEKANPSNTLTVNGAATVAAGVLTPVGPSNPTITGSEGGFTGNLVSFSDANSSAQAGDFTAAITWGNNVSNNGTVTKNANGTFTVSGTNPAPEDGTSFPSSVLIHDNASHSLTMPFTFAVTEPALSARGLTVSTDSKGVFSTAPVATFTHGANAEPVTAFTTMIDWGDGTAPSPGSVVFTANGYNILGSHTYAGPGTFHLTVSVTDEGAPNTVTAVATVAAPPTGTSGPSAPSAPTPTAGDHFVTQVFHDLGEALDTPTLQRFAAELDQGASPRQVALDLVASLGKSLHGVLRQLTGGGSTTKRARQLFVRLLDHPPASKADTALVRSVARKLAQKKTEAQALVLLLSSPGYLALAES
jgi:uncharacterized protein (TIGR03118 family)